MLRDIAHGADAPRRVSLFWLLGMVTSYTMGGLIHILLVIAIVVVLVRIIQGRRVL